MSGTIDGKAWLEKRLKHLRATLEGDELSHSQRVLVETEIAELEDELAREKRKVWRWLLWGGRRS